MVLGERGATLQRFFANGTTRLVSLHAAWWARRVIGLGIAIVVWQGGVAAGPGIWVTIRVYRHIDTRLVFISGSILLVLVTN